MATFTRIPALLFFISAFTTAAKDIADGPVAGAFEENHIMNAAKPGVAGTDQATFKPTDGDQVPGRHLQDPEHEIDKPRRKQKQEFAKMPKAAGKDPFEKNIILDTADDDMHRYAKKLSATSVQMSALYDSMNSQMKTYKDSLIVLVHAAKELMRNMRKTLNEEANAVDLENHARMLPIDSLDDLVLHHVQNYAWKKKGDYQHESIDAVEQATKTMHDQTTKTSQDNMMKHKNDQIVQAAKATEFATTLQKKQKDDLSMEHAGDKLTAEELANQVKALLKHETEHRLTIAVKADKDAEYEKQRAAYLETVITQGTERLTEKKARQVQDKKVRDADAKIKQNEDDTKKATNAVNVATAAVKTSQAQVSHHTAQKDVANAAATHVADSAIKIQRYTDLLTKATQREEKAKEVLATHVAAKADLDTAKATEDTALTALEAEHTTKEAERSTKLAEAEAALKAARLQEPASTQ